ncbi:MAG: hypothetical protein KDA80_01690 [Planctomycetaceae bacterium]|nr:hypothetical protein [Planctomycetaceae bacterium]
MLQQLVPPGPIRVMTRPSAMTRIVRRICFRYRKAIRGVEDFDTPIEVIERRESPRIPVGIPFLLQPVRFAGRTAYSDGDAPMVAVTRDISNRGIGFQCDGHLACRHCLAEFDACDETVIQMILEVRWSKRESRFSTVAGTRIVGVVMMESPADSAPTSEESDFPDPIPAS